MIICLNRCKFENTKILITRTFVAFTRVRKIQNTKRLMKRTFLAFSHERLRLTINHMEVKNANLPVIAIITLLHPWSGDS